MDRFRDLLGLLLVSVEGREWGFNAETAFAAAAFGGGIFWGVEGEEADGDGVVWWRVAVLERGFGG